MLTLKLSEKVFGHLAKCIHQDVEPASVGHAYNDFFYTTISRGINNFIHAGNKRLTALQ